MIESRDFYERIAEGEDKAHDFTLPTDDGFTLYGILNEAVVPGDGKLLVIMHGMGGHPMEYLHQTAMRYFTQAGYDVARFSFYSSEDDSRKLRHCLLKNQVADLHNVLAHFRGKYKKTCVAGHSYGGMTALVANPDVAAVSLWDSSLYPYHEYWARETSYEERLGYYVLDYGYEILVSKAMVEESCSYDMAAMEKLAQDFRSPFHIGVAGAHVDRPGQKQVFDLIRTPKKYSFIAGADHDFASGSTVFELMDETHEFFERF